MPISSDTTQTATLTIILTVVSIVVTIIGLVINSWYMKKQVKALEKQVSLQFFTELNVTFPLSILSIKSAKFPVLIKNIGSQNIKISEIYLSNNSFTSDIPIKTNKSSITGNSELIIDIFIELNEALKKMKVYDPANRIVRDRNTQVFILKYMWEAQGLGKKDGEKILVFAWSGGKDGTGIQWSVDSR